MTKIKCKCCNKFVRPDRRNYWRQRYCSKPECKAESKKNSQKKYMEKPENQKAYCGAAAVERVREWRSHNPGYGKRNKKRKVLQDIVNSQSVPVKGDTINERPFALQDVVNLQPALLLGVISQLTGHALQDDMVTVVQKMIQKGQQILETKVA